MKSIAAMIEQLSAMLGTADLSAWEAQFVQSIVARRDAGQSTEALTDKQVEKIENLYNIHFGDAA